MLVVRGVEGVGGRVGGALVSPRCFASMSSALRGRERQEKVEPMEARDRKKCTKETWHSKQGGESVTRNGTDLVESVAEEAAEIPMALTRGHKIRHFVAAEDSQVLCRIANELAG